MRALFAGFLVLLSLPALAADLTLSLPAGTRTLSTTELLKHPQLQALDIANDVAYERPMHYRAIPLAALLEGVKDSDHLQVVALDGFAAELAAGPVLQQAGSRAWLAIEDPAQPWPKLGADKPSAGPFYLVWTNPEASHIGPEQWPFQVAKISRLTSLAERFPALLPASDASADVQAGFAQLQKNCLACHRLNGAGDAQFGPDLNLPHNPTEYFSGDFLARYIRDPQSLRRWPQGKMPGFSPQVLSDAELQQLIAYLRHMAGRKAS
ncbi:cytochrome c [Pseudomonas sp. GV071]|uniref:c-type cytochrome n=1 Tax=Pseudomonas sp. GV071 TaxID=2135754 RepID=UPI000D34D899|nr:cytochrome c [Pseudomonas sp. GV071]PTQ74071.1 cytochrome c [Pseudomonas sp. GV071]